MKYKVVAKDNFDRDNVSEFVVGRDMSKMYAEMLAEQLNARQCCGAPHYYSAVPENTLICYGDHEDNLVGVYQENTTEYEKAFEEMTYGERIVKLSQEDFHLYKILMKALDFSVEKGLPKASIQRAIDILLNTI